MDDKTKRIVEGIEYYVKKSVEFNGTRYHRRAIKTDFVNRGDSIQDMIIKYIEPLYDEDDIVAINRKVVSICQNRIKDKKDVKLGLWSKILAGVSSKVISKNIIGTGCDSPHKFQVLIKEVGLYDVLHAYVAGMVGSEGTFAKMLGKKISVYNIFNELSPFDNYKDMAILGTKDAEKICNDIYDNTGVMCMIVDSNRYNTEVLAKCDTLLCHSYDSLCTFIKDNPFGDADALIPFVMMKPLHKGQDDDYPYSESDAKGTSKEKTNVLSDKN